MPRFVKTPKRASQSEHEQLLTALVFMVSIMLENAVIRDDDAELFGYCESILSKYLKRRRAEVLNNVS